MCFCPCVFVNCPVCLTRFFFLSTAYPSALEYSSEIFTKRSIIDQYASYVSPYRQIKKMKDGIINKTARVSMVWEYA